MPHLLVSVRNAIETEAALAGGADLIDIKEPANGSLGRADAPAIESIIRAVSGRAPISAAGGELEVARKPLPLGLTFAKFGLSGWENLDWVGECTRAALPAGCKFVAAAYADYQSCDAPLPDDIAAAAIEHHFGAYLIDTFEKNGTTLLDRLPVAVITQLVRRCQAAGVPVALAGSLGLAEIERLRDVNPDWFAVRGAACVGGRGGTIDEARVRELKAALT